MAHPRYKTTALPTLGAYTVPFYNESASILDFFTDAELERLNRVDHLGLSSQIFAGSNHSRLEYTLLQCAVVHLLPKLHPGNEQLGLSAKVTLGGVTTPVASGEELLKCWALLGNIGHPKYTYAVEISLLQKAYDDANFRTLLLNNIPSKRLKRWADAVIRNYEVESFHYILTLQRIFTENRTRRAKFRLAHILSNLLLPLDELDFVRHEDRYKIYRLRELYKQIRLLCLVTLDSYYSHHPVRYQLTEALLNLSNLIHQPGSRSDFIELLERTAGWFADELYLHPDAIAAQRGYEHTSRQKIDGQYRKHFDNIDTFNVFLPNLVNNGFGKPRLHLFSPLFRISFSRRDLLQRSSTDEYALRTQIESETASPPRTAVAVSENPYTKRFHTDFLYSPEYCEPSDIGHLLSNVRIWLTKLLNHESQRALSDLPPKLRRQLTDAVTSRLQQDHFHRSAVSHQDTVQNVFDGLLRYLVPHGYYGSIAEHLPDDRDDHPIRWRIKTDKGMAFDNIDEKLSSTRKNATAYSRSRSHEIETLHYLYKRSSAPFLATCTESFVIRDSKGNYIDEWDGTLLSISPTDVSLQIIEAKALSSKKKRENESFKQLQSTRKFIHKRHRLKTRRTRISNRGAFLSLYFN